jgi:predicted Fe-S protein YdhL (DUF1289 family)
MDEVLHEATTALDPASPCIRVCVLDAHGYCMGCERHIDEIVAWSQLSARRKQALLDELPSRRRLRDAAR